MSDSKSTEGDISNLASGGIPFATAATFATKEFYAHVDNNIEVAVRVFKARRHLRELQAAREAKEASVAKLKESVKSVSKQEQSNLAAYLQLKDTLESTLFDMCSNSKEVREVDALRKLLTIRNQEDHLTFVNLREQLKELSEEATVAIETMKEMRDEANGSYRRYIDGNQQAHNEASEQRKLLLGLRGEIMEMESKGKQAMLNHGRDIFHVLN